MLAAQVEGTDPELRALSLRGRDLYDSLAPALLQSTGIDIGLWRDGIACLALSENEATALREEVAQQRQAGLRCDWLDAEEVTERFPAAAPSLGALLSPEDGAVNAPALHRALLSDALRLGVLQQHTRVNRITSILGRATGVKTSAGTSIRAEHVLVAAGAWGSRIEGLPRALPVEPVRGQMAALPWPAKFPPAILYGDHAYVLARGDEALLGSTMEHVGFDAGVTEAGIAKIVASAVRLLPALDGRPLARTWAGLRPVSPDARPIVGPDPEVRGLWYATGHGRNGVLLAALTGEIIADLVTTGASTSEIAPLDPGRFTS
jgi:glycine oxidase